MLAEPLPLRVNRPQREDSILRGWRGRDSRQIEGKKSALPQHPGQQPADDLGDGDDRTRRDPAGLGQTEERIDHREGNVHGIRGISTFHVGRTTSLIYVGSVKSLLTSHLPRKLLIAVIHLRPLPGSPRWGGDFQAVVDAARADAEAYREGGADAVIVENFGDAPFTRGAVGPETVAAMSAAAVTLREALGELPLGFNVLRNDAESALALCAVHGGAFIRVNVLSGAMVTDQGIIEGDAHLVARRRAVLCPHAVIFADVHVKHARPLADFSIEESARDTLERGLADALVVTGVGTGKGADPSDLARVRRACPDARLFVGSGISVESFPLYAADANGFIVGSSLKFDGVLTKAVDRERVAELRTALDRHS